MTPEQILAEAYAPLVQDENETEDTFFADFWALSLPTLQEYWNSEEDAVYDNL